MEGGVGVVPIIFAQTNIIKVNAGDPLGGAPLDWFWGGGGVWACIKI